MKFKYRIIWTNTAKNKQEWCDMSEQNIAIFIAKQKVRVGMQDVIIQVTAEYGEDTETKIVDAE